MHFKKVIYITLGCLCVGLGAVGAAIPFLPTFPFLMVAAFCFAKSSVRLHTWFVATKLYKNNLESYINGNGMTVKTKLRIVFVVTVTMLLGFIFMSSVPLGQIILAIVWVLHLIYFTFAVKTIKIK